MTLHPTRGPHAPRPLATPDLRAPDRLPWPVAALVIVAACVLAWFAAAFAVGS